jgi:hypothetical protein
LQKLISPLRLRVLISFLIICCYINTSAQLVVKGIVYDSTKINLVEGVQVESKSGKKVVTDSLGKYSIEVMDNDSLFFSFRNKTTPGYAVKKIIDPNNFDIRIHIKVKGKYTTLQEVIVRGKSYKEDSIENRERYAKAFNYRRGHVGSSVTPGGGVGLDINDLINLFRFRRNKQLKAFRNRLEREEKERYVNYRFNKTLVTRITNLKSTALDSFMVKYRPDYEFVKYCDDVLMNEYIIRAWYHFKQENNMYIAPKKPGQLPPLY